MNRQILERPLETRDFFSIRVEESKAGYEFKDALRFKSNGKIKLHCQKPNGCGYLGEFFDYKKVGDDWVVVDDMKRLREFGIKRRYLPGTPVHEAFEELSRLELGAGL